MLSNLIILVLSEQIYNNIDNTNIEYYCNITTHIQQLVNQFKKS